MPKWTDGKPDAALLYSTKSIIAPTVTLPPPHTHNHIARGGGIKLQGTEEQEEERDIIRSRRVSAFSRHFRCRFSVRRACSFQLARFKREDAQSHTAAPLTRSLGRSRLRRAIALSSAPAAAAAIYCPTPTYLPSFLPTFSPEAIPTNLSLSTLKRALTASKPQVCSMQCYPARRRSHLSPVFPIHRFHPSIHFRHFPRLSRVKSLAASRRIRRRGTATAYVRVASS